LLELKESKRFFKKRNEKRKRFFDKFHNDIGWVSAAVVILMLSKKSLAGKQFRLVLK